MASLTYFSSVSLTIFSLASLNESHTRYSIPFLISECFHEHSLQRTVQPVAGVNHLSLSSEGLIQGKLQQPCRAHTMPHPLFSFEMKGNRDSVPALHRVGHIFFLLDTFFSLLVLINDQDKFMQSDSTYLRINSSVCHEAKEYFCAPIGMQPYRGENTSCS